jgi:hypothetical protein
MLITVLLCILINIHKTQAGCKGPLMVGTKLKMVKLVFNRHIGPVSIVAL